MPYPATRLRRMRRDAFSRRLMRETRLGSEDLIWPVFVLEDGNVPEPVASMPGVVRLPRAALVERAREAWALGLPAVALCTRS